VLDMRGVRKLEQSSYVDQYRKVKPNAASEMANAGPSASSAASGEESRIKKLENMIKKRL